MKCCEIIFPRANTAELHNTEIDGPTDYEVIVRMKCTAVSAGTERATITGNIHVDASRPLSSKVPQFPRWAGYSGAGVVYKTGKKVTRVQPGDRVAVRASTHRSFCCLNENFVYKIPDDTITYAEACMSYISSFSLAGVRKTRLEIGESCIVMGLGILGLFSIQFCRAAGAVPIIAVDPIAEKRDFARKLGADYALDPTAADFTQQVKAITGGNGANTAVEVTGTGKALDQVLDCMARHGRVSLLGCTRESEFTIDYYRKVHYPGIVLIGAHTGTRPENESRPGYWCYDDEFETIFKLISNHRVDYKAMIHALYSPAEAHAVYSRLINDPAFPCGVLFDWSQIE